MDTKTLLSIKQVGKTFSNGTVALQDMSLDVQEGSFVSLLGPSGCGKSTVLKIIAGLGNLTTGNISWPMAKVDQLGRPDHEISFVFQEPTLMLWATVFDNVWLPLRLKGVKRHKARAAVNEALEMVGLQDFASSYPRELSGGMKMRVSIARALVTRPKLLLMDEPFAALDEITRSKLNDDLLRLWQQMNWTIIFVTHSVFESAYLSNRIVVMAARPGRVVADIAVDAPYPRGGAEFRSSETYIEASNAASKALHAAMQSGDHL